VRRIREETGDGEELVDYMLRVFRAEGESTKTRVEAASWLADRGFGRPQQTTLVGTVDEEASHSPYAHLSDEELKAKLRLLEGGGVRGPTPKRGDDRAGPSPASVPRYRVPCTHSFGSMIPRFSTTSNLPLRAWAMYMFIRT
jgi:hypothetical protein